MKWWASLYNLYQQCFEVVPFLPALFLRNHFAAQELCKVLTWTGTLRFHTQVLQAGPLHCQVEAKGISFQPTWLGESDRSLYPETRQRYWKEKSKNTNLVFSFNEDSFSFNWQVIDLSLKTFILHINLTSHFEKTLPTFETKQANFFSNQKGTYLEQLFLHNWNCICNGSGMCHLELTSHPSVAIRGVTLEVYTEIFISKMKISF